MHAKTSKSLLQKAKHDPSSEAWFQLNSIYNPLIAGWIARAGVEESDVGDITQEVMQTLAQELRKFEHNGRIGAFRNWLKTITINRCRRYWDSKKRQLPASKLLNEDSALKILNELEDPSSRVSMLWESEHDNYVLERIMQLIQNEFDQKDFNVFVRNSVNGESPKTIAEEFGISVGNVYKIKFRVLKRLREAADGLLDDHLFQPETPE